MKRTIVIRIALNGGSRYNHAESYNVNHLLLFL